MKKWIQDLVLGIVLLVFSVVSFVYAYIMQDASAKYFLARADTYILLWTGILGILSVALIVRSLRQRPSEPAPQIVTKRVLVTVVIIALYIALLETLGFIVSSVLMLLSLLLFFTLEAKGKLRGKELLKQVLICLLITVITVAVVYCLFSIALGVRLPAGIFE